MKKIGKLEFKDHAARKPLSVSPTGEFLTAEEVLASPSLQSSSLLALPKEKQVELAIKRYELEPEIRISTLGVGMLTKKEVIEHLKRQDDFGQTVLEAEMGYCNELLMNINPDIIPGFPPEPRNPITDKPEWKPTKKFVIIRLQTRALFCENSTDSVTTPFAVYRKAHVQPVFLKRGFKVVVLTGTEDVRTNFIPEAKNKLTVYLTGIGHGSYTTYTGHNGNPILVVNSYDRQEVEGKVIHFLSCQTAKQLGPDAVSKGARSYVGYDESFHLVWDAPGTAVNEWECFAEADSAFDIMMAKGATVKQAYDATIATFNAEMAKPGIPGSAAAAWLAYDRDHLKLLGDPAATILPYRYMRVAFPFVNPAMENVIAEVGEMVE